MSDKSYATSFAVSVSAVVAFMTVGLFGTQAIARQAADTTLEQMPPELETQFALSALPRTLRDRATVFLLDPGKGYHISRHGTSGVACLVERTAWELSDFRNDIYIPLCFDAAGTTYLRVIRDAAALRAQGMRPVALKAEVEKRYRNGTYPVPEKAGVSYMVSPLYRTVAPPDLKVHTTSMPHLMFYAPGITNEDIAAAPNLADHSSLQYPFIDRQGIGQQSYMIQLVGETEKARILDDERALVAALCAHRAVLCYPESKG